MAIDISQKDIEAFWKKYTKVALPADVVEKICPDCAEKMKDLGIGELHISEKQIPRQLTEGLCEKFGGQDDFFRECVQSTLGEFEPAQKDAFCAWLKDQCYPGWRTKSEGFELTGPIVAKNKKKRIVYAAVAVPGEVDYDGEVLTKEKIEDACHEWAELYKNVDYKHSFNNCGLPVEFYLTYSDRVVKTVHDPEELILPEGTWIMGSKVMDKVYKECEEGKLAGYSLTGIRRAALKALKEKGLTLALKSMEESGELEPALKKTLLRDLGPDWVPVSVSLVESPAVPKSKWFALKSKKQQPKGLIAKISGFVKPAEKEGRRFSKSTVSKIKALAEELGALLKDIDDQERKKKEEVKIIKGGKKMDIAEEKLQEMINKAVKAQVDELKTEIEALKAELEEKEKPKESTKKTKDNGGLKTEDNAKKDTEIPQPSVKKDEDFKALKGEVESLKTSIEGITKALGLDSSKVIKGQDGEKDTAEVSKKDFGKRDGFGRKKNNKEDK